MKFIYILSLSYIGANLLIFNRLTKEINPQNKNTKIVIGVLYWIFALSFIIPFIIKSGNTLLIKTATTIGGFWLIGTAIMFILLLINLLLNRFFTSFKYGFISSAFITILILTYGYINHTQIHRQHIEIVTEKKIDKPIKIVAVSDIHLGYLTGKNRCRKIVEKINKEKPDLILIAGDLIDNNIEPVRNAHMEEELQKLEASYGTYMAPGNHDHYSGMDNCSAFAKSSGITLLIDSIATIANQIQIIGRDDYSNRNRKTIEELLNKVGTNLVTIVIDHQPQQLKQISEYPIDLQISGHTHNGQIFPIITVR